MTGSGSRPPDVRLSDSPFKKKLRNNHEKEETKVEALP